MERPLRLTLAELKSRFPHKTYRMVLECGGNGRSFFEPQAEGNPWTNGGAGCAEWTGVSLGDVLREAGLKETALFTGHFGADPDKHGSHEHQAMSRGVPIAKALEEHTLLVWAMNGEPLPFLHGGPLRLIVPGWPGSLSQKWLTRIWIRDREHDGPGMTGLSYRLPVHPLPPGSDGKGVALRILESMPVRSIVSAPADGARYPAGTRAIDIRGAAWAGDDGVARVEVTLDGGATWTEAAMTPPRNRYDWVRWQASACRCRATALTRSSPAPRTRKAAPSPSMPPTGTRTATAATSCTGCGLRSGPRPDGDRGGAGLRSAGLACGCARPGRRSPSGTGCCRRRARCRR